ncbi:35281_t:CDS:2, partial [Gigaspora margarita]
MLLNKIRVVGKVLPREFKEKSLTKELIAYFSLLVTNPNEVQTVLRCHASGKTALALQQEVSDEEIIEARGYLRNEKEGRQIIIQVVEFSKLPEIPSQAVNQVRLLGRIINNCELADKEKDVFSFKIEVPTKDNPLNTFFCRIQGDESGTNFFGSGPMFRVAGYGRTIQRLVWGIQRGQKEQVLLGATGTGKTFTMANIIQQTQKSTLILVHNKTLAMQIYQEKQNYYEILGLEENASFAEIEK